MIVISDIEQGTAEWRMLKLGVPSAGRFGDIITPSKGDYSKSADRYMLQLIAEKITNKPTETYSNGNMEKGIEMEAEAREWFVLTQNKDVRQVGFIYRDERKLIGCSPDGIIYDDGIMDDEGIEIKRPASSTMVQYLLDGTLPLIYKPQIQGSMFITGFKHWYFLAYHEDFTNPLLLLINRDDEYISKMEKHLHKFTTDLTSKLKKVQAAQ